MLGKLSRVKEKKKSQFNLSKYMKITNGKSQLFTEINPLTKRLLQGL